MPGLDQLGWLQFERLCELVLEAETGTTLTEWEGSADGLRRCVSHEPLKIGTWTLEPPVLIRCAWLRGDAGVRWRNTDRDARTRVTFVNGEASDDLGDIVYGETELMHAIAGLPDLRLRLPSVLSLDVVPPDPAALTASTIDFEAVRELARVFVPTPAWHQTVAVLRAHHFAVLTGPPEMGKTAIARMLGYALLTTGWEVHECTRPEQVWGRLDRERPQLFIADDAFGSTEYRPDAADRWAADLDRILRATDDQHWLVWTSRPAPLRAGLRRVHRERGTERFPQPAEVQVDASALGPEEKSLILFRHALDAGLPYAERNALRRTGRTIVEHPHFTPERIRRFVARGARAEDVERELTEPTEAMAASLASLDPELRGLLFALLDSPPGPVAERDLAEALRRHAFHGLPKAPVDLVDRLADHFVRVIA